MSKPFHGGNLRRLASLAGRPVEEILDFSASINPLGPPPWLGSLIQSRISELEHYPDPDAKALIMAAAHYYHAPAEEIVVGNGSSELLRVLARVSGKRRAIIPVPAYGEYALAARSAGMEIKEIRLSPADGFAGETGKWGEGLCSNDAVFLGQPNNPTGRSWRPDDLRRAAEACPETLVVVDEAFADFAEGLDRMAESRPSNVAVLLSLTKIFAVPGLRIGCLVADPDICEKMRLELPTWSVNALAQAVGEAALEDTGYIQKTRRFVGLWRLAMRERLRGIGGLTVFPGEANFLLARLDLGNITADELAGQLLREEGIAIRGCADFSGLDGHYFRMAVRRSEENERLCAAMEKRLAATRR